MLVPKPFLFIFSKWGSSILGSLVPENFRPRYLLKTFDLSKNLKEHSSFEWATGQFWLEKFFCQRFKQQKEAEGARMPRANICLSQESCSPSLEKVLC